MAVVMDSSVFVCWQFPDEDTKLVQPAIDVMLDRGAVIPVHWTAEVANVFALGVRRGRMQAAFRSGILERISDLPLTVDQASADAFFSTTQALCDRYELTAYDAAYLELSRRRALPLATLDKRLAAAAALEGVQLTVAPE